MSFVNRKSAAAAATLLVLSLVTLHACNNPQADARTTRADGKRELPEIKGEEKAVLTFAPNVPPPITRKHATRVIVELETVEKTMRLADGIDYAFWTFNGSVPGVFIRVREGDLVELRMANAAQSMFPHNIDLHAVTGPGGGAAATTTMPGEMSAMTFRALNPGLYMYHCAASPVPLHIGNGMYGMILVEPREGMPKVDREFYIMQSEFYAKRGAAGQPYTLDMEKGDAEQPTHVVFNGSVGALVGDKALSVEVGQSVRLYVGNGGPNLVSSFHLIGEIFDNVYGEGGTRVSQQNVQTTLIPAGGAAMVDFTVEVTGTLVLVDHSIFRAFNKGALGLMNVTGADNPAIYQQLKGVAGGKHY